MKKKFVIGEMVVLVFAETHGHIENDLGRALVNPFDVDVEYPTTITEGSEDEAGNWGATVRRENGEEIWLPQDFIVTERD